MSAKLKTVELDARTLEVLQRRASERGLSVPALIAEFAEREVAAVGIEAEDIASLDEEWAAVVRDGSIPHHRVVRWLETWGTADFRPWRE